jgi:dihydroxy-acid dehydratase
MTGIDRKPRSRVVTDGIEATTSRGMLRAVGMGDTDWDKPQVGIASSWNEITPCNLSLGRLAQAAKEGVHAGGGYPLQFGTISVSDGISMGHEGMHFSLVSREVIADSVETVVQAERLDGTVLLAGCDKSIPGMLMAAARLDLASAFLYAGSIAPGWVKLSDGTEKDITIIDSFEAVGAVKAGKMSVEDARRIECAFAPGEGACGGMYTANTMASVAEALGMSLPGSASPASYDRRRDNFAHLSGEAVVGMLDRGQTARDILTIKAFENAITIIMVLGGSTNAVLHMIAMAKSVGVEVTQDDFQTISDKVPVLADFKPSGKYLMEDVHKMGGIPVVMKYLLKHGLIHGDCLTVTGKTVAENLADQCLGKFLRVEGLQVFEFFANADEINLQRLDGLWVALLSPQGNGGQYTAFGCAVEFGDDQTCQAQRFIKRLDLCQSVLPCVAIDHQQHFMRCGGVSLLDNPLDFFQLVHQV